MDASPRPGAVVVGYRLEAHLGDGPMARVYHATHIASARPCALKVFQPHRVSAAALERFHRLAQRAASLPGGGAIPILEVGHDGGVAVVAAQLSAYAPFPGGPLPWRGAVARLLPVARALAELHRAGLVHGDLKPTNLRAAGDPRAGLHLLDVGAYVLREPDDHGATQAHELFPVDYQAPEQLLGEGVEPASDCYTLGILLYELLSGRRPFAGKTTQIAHQHVRAAPPPLGLPIPPELDRLVQRLLAKADKRRERPRADEVAAVLDALLPSPDEECSTQLWSRPKRPPAAATPAPSSEHTLVTPAPARPLARALAPSSAAPHTLVTTPPARPLERAPSPSSATQHTLVAAVPARPHAASGETVVLSAHMSSDSGVVTLIPADIGAEFLPGSDTLSGERSRAGQSHSLTVIVRPDHQLPAHSGPKAPTRPSWWRPRLRALGQRLRGPWRLRTKLLAALNITCLLIVIIGLTLIFADR